VAFKQRVTARVVRQFGHPRGIAGRAAGWVMAHRPSNRTGPVRCGGRTPAEPPAARRQAREERTIA
jgi:hypothetical protein